MKVSVIAPAYNEEPNIKPLIDAFEEFVRKHNLKDWELIIVDDGSRDRTYQVAMEYSRDRDNIKVAKLPVNRGKTDAIKEGFKHASGKYVIIFDADLQFSFQDVKRIVEKLDEGWDLVAGYKVGRYEKRFVSRIYNLLSRLFFGVKVRDMNALKGMRREVLEVIPLRKEWHRYIIPIAYHYGFSITEIPVKLYPRKAGESKYRGKLRILIGFMDLIAVRFLLTFMEKPLLLFGTLGFVSLFLGFVVGVVALILRFGYGIGYRPLIYLTMLFILAGLLLLSMGFLGEMISYANDRCRDYRKE